ELQRVLGAQLGRLLDEGSTVGQRGDARPCAHREVMAAVRAHPEGRLELVIPVVRSALRARVRVLLSRRLWDVPMLDGDVDPGGHGTDEFRLTRREASYRPKAPASLESGPTFPDSKLEPVNPAPRTLVRLAISPRIRSASVSERPSGSGMKTAVSVGSSTSTSKAT